MKCVYSAVFSWYILLRPPLYKKIRCKIHKSPQLASASQLLQTESYTAVNLILSEVRLAVQANKVQIQKHSTTSLSRVRLCAHRMGTRISNG